MSLDALPLDSVPPTLLLFALLASSPSGYHDIFYRDALLKREGEREKKKEGETTRTRIVKRLIFYRDRRSALNTVLRSIFFMFHGT